MQELFFQNKVEWRDWLILNHQTAPPIWITFFKKGSGIPCISYNESVEQALCYGWIDSLVKSIDSKSFKRKFQQRINLNQWSESNKQRVEKLLLLGEMTEFGLNKIGNYKQTREFVWPVDNKKPIANFSPKLIVLMHQNPMATLFFESLSPSYKQKYIDWVMSAKKEKTQFRRMEKTIQFLEKETKFVLK